MQKVKLSPSSLKLNFMDSYCIEKILCCPFCKGEIIKDRNLGYICSDHGEYPIIDGIPSFVDITSDEFDIHWKKNGTLSIPSSKLRVAYDFLRPLLLEADKMEHNFLCLDAGCGDGVHINVLNEKKNLNVVGLDYSMEALRLSRRRKNKRAKFIKGNASQLPFSDNVFDCAFSFGVLAYTESPAQSFQELCRVVSPGGLIGIWIATYQEGGLGKLLHFTRRVCQFIGPYMTARVADILVPFLGVLPTASKMSLSNASWKQCREVIMVNIAPLNIYFPTVLEVEGWFKENRIKIMWTNKDPSLVIWGKKGDVL